MPCIRNVIHRELMKVACSNVFPTVTRKVVKIRLRTDSDLEDPAIKQKLLQQVKSSFHSFVGNSALVWTGDTIVINHQLTKHRRTAEFSINC